MSSSVLIVGASGSIGSAVAEKLAMPGRRLALHYCGNAERVNHLQKQLSAAGSVCKAIKSDLQSEDDCKGLVQQSCEMLDGITGVAICAGTIKWKDWKELNEGDWREMLFQHCISPYFIAQQAIAAMSANSEGRIVYLSSISPKYGGSAMSIHYAAAKAAMETSMYGLARQVSQSGIRINGVRAGFVDTPQQRAGRSPEELSARIGKIPLRRAGTPAEIASAFAYLFSSDAAFIHGELITVAGGD